MLGRRNDQSDDLVSQALAATRQLPLAEGPSAAVMSQTLAALREAASRPKVTFLQRVYHMPWTSKTIAILATAASLLVAYVGVSTFTGTALAFADVVEALNKVRTATWKTTTDIKMPTEEVTNPTTQAKRSQNTTTTIAPLAGGALALQAKNKTITITGVGMFLAPSHERLETTVQGATASIQIVDGQKGKAITLIPTAKIATVIELKLKNMPPKMESPFGRTFLGLREIVGKAQDAKIGKVERLGSGTIDGRPAQGFRIELGSVEIKIWADPKTLLPVHVEETTTSGPKVHIVMTDFQTDVDLDKSLFSLDVPPGYTIQQLTLPVDFSKSPISFLADGLKMVAEQNNGIFPPALRGEEGIDGIMQRSAKTSAEKHVNQSPEDMFKRLNDSAMKLGGAFGFLYSLSPDNDWHYAGKGVKLNTPDRPIFWYKPHKKGATYQVLYADLSVKEIPAKDLPKIEPSQERSKP